MTTDAIVEPNIAPNTTQNIAQSVDSNVVAGEGARNPILWPFAIDSIWNQPIGDGAEYVPANLESERLLTADTDHFFVLRPDDPRQDLFSIGGWRNRSTGTRERDTDLPLPDALIIPDTNEHETPNNSSAFLLPDGNTLVQLNATTRDRLGGPIYGVQYPVRPYENPTLDGDGILGGHGGSGLSSIGGTIRIGELVDDDPIRHALKINLWAKKYLAYVEGPDGGLGYRWPAIKADGYVDATTYGGAVPELVMGSLLALPPDLTPEELGLQTEPAKKLFYAFQDYGAYVADDTARDVHAIEVESGVLQEFEYAYGYSFKDNSSPFYDDVMTLFGSLNVVKNNGPEAIGGGGMPRAEAAPPLDSGAIADLQSLLADPTVEDTFEADFNGDGYTDLLWRNLASGAIQAWLRDETGEIIGGGNILPLADWDWQIVDTPDVDGDGRADLLWRDRVTNAEQIWYLDDLRLWLDPATGQRVARWGESASGPPRIETLGSSLRPLNPPLPLLSEPYQYEAESLALNGYAVVDDSASGASGNQFVSLFPTVTEGTISGVFDGVPGDYDVSLLFFDENDGEASLTFTVADDRTSLLLNEDFADASASPLSLTQTITHEAIALQTGDAFTISGTANEKEFARVDAIVFTPVANGDAQITSSIAPPDGPVEPPITVAPASDVTAENPVESPNNLVESVTPDDSAADVTTDALVEPPITVVSDPDAPDEAPVEDPVEPALTVLAAPDVIADEPVSAAASSFMDQVIALTNALRIEAGLELVTFNPTLATAAQQHTDDMAQYGFFSHLGLNRSTPLSRVDAVIQSDRALSNSVIDSVENSLDAVADDVADAVADDVADDAPNEEPAEQTRWAIAENIGVGYATPEAIVDAWATSPSHLSHLLNPDYDIIGIGYTIVAADEAQPSFTPYWTQLLGVDFS